MKKTFHILTCCLLLTAMALFQSCLKDDDKLYGDEGDRVENYLKNAKSVLTNSEHGWHLEYYPHRELKYGGFNYCLKFTDDNKVTVWYEDAKGESVTSTYNLVGDDGPVLTFDTYNKLMHIFATPSQGEYEAKDGDFEFILLKVTDSEITLKGKRSGNVMYMHKLNGDPTDYLSDLEATKAKYHRYGAGTAEWGGNQYSALFDLQNRKFTLLDKDGAEVDHRMLIYTDKGFKLASPLAWDGEQLQDFTFNDDAAEKTFTSGNVTFKMQETYKTYNDFIGSYTILELSNRTVTLQKDVEGQSYIVKNLGSGGYNTVAYSDAGDESKGIAPLKGDGNPRAYYDEYWGKLYFKPVFIGQSSGFQKTYYIYLYTTDGDMVYFDDQYPCKTAAYPGSAIKIQVGANGMGITDWFWTKPRPNDEGSESAGNFDDFPIPMTWTKK